MPQFGQTISGAERKAARSEAGRRLVQQRWRDAAGGSDEEDSDEELTEEQRAALEELALAARDIRASDTPKESKRQNGHHLKRSRSGNRIVAQHSNSTPPKVADGSRIIDVALMSEELGPLLVCPKCNKKGTMVVSGRDELQMGLASTLRWWCSRCECATFKQHTSRSLPRGEGQMGPATKAINVTAVAAAVQSGMGGQGVATLLSVMGIHAPHHTSWEAAEAVAYPAMEETGRSSAKKAIVEERILALAADVGPNGDGETPQVISYDARWPRRTRAMNSLDGYGHAAYRTHRIPGR